MHLQGWHLLACYAPWAKRIIVGAWHLGRFCCALLTLSSVHTGHWALGTCRMLPVRAVPPLPDLAAF